MLCNFTDKCLSAGEISFQEKDRLIECIRNAVKTVFHDYGSDFPHLYQHSKEFTKIQITTDFSI